MAISPEGDNEPQKGKRAELIADGEGWSTKIIAAQMGYKKDWRQEIRNWIGQRVY